MRWSVGTTKRYVDEHARGSSACAWVCDRVVKAGAWVVFVSHKTLGGLRMLAMTFRKSSCVWRCALTIRPGQRVQATGSPGGGGLC